MISLLNDEIGFTPYEIFNVQKGDFVAWALKIFSFQYQNNVVYRKFCDLRGVHGLFSVITNRANDYLVKNESDRIVGDNTNNGDFAGNAAPVGVITNWANDGVGEKEIEGENLKSKISNFKSPSSRFPSLKPTA
jgi:hypothetical protein